MIHEAGEFELAVKYVACPRCGKKAEESCFQPNGRALQQPHMGRILVYREVQDMMSRRIDDRS